VAAFAASLLDVPPVKAAECASLTEVAEGVFVREGIDAPVFEQSAIANVGFVVGETCVAVIDTGGSPSEGADLRCALRRQTELPVCFVINTHVHPDHVLGNRALVESGTVVVGHTHLARAMAMLGSFYLERLAQWEGRETDRDDLVLPGRAVADTLQLDLGGRQLELRAHASAHTNTDLSIFDPQSGTLWLSDLLFVRHVPVVAGSARGWLEALEGLRQLPAQRAVPGHGPASVPWPQASEDQIRYLTRLREDTRAWLNEGGELGEAASHVARDEATRWTLFDAYHGRNVSAAYTELEWED
jgi:quinoprotein relay system zinc metallohydrolase 2